MSKDNSVRLKRSKLLLNIAKTFLWDKLESASTINDIVNPDTLMLFNRKRFKKDCSLYFIGTHKSMWETGGISYVIDKYSKDVPFAMVGNNLFNGKMGPMESITKYFLDRTGSVTVNRDSVRFSYEMMNNIEKILSHNNGLLLFPEGTRSRDGLVKKFNNAGFQGAINASKNTDVYIIPVNVDYSKLMEIENSTIEKFTQSKYEFKFKDLIKMHDLGNIYVSFGKPILVDPSYNREKLSNQTRTECMDLVKILPINVISEAISRLNHTPDIDSPIDLGRLEDNVKDVFEKLRGQEKKFIGFNSTASIKELLDQLNIKTYGNSMAAPKGLVAKSQIYANYIHHYIYED